MALTSERPEAIERQGRKRYLPMSAGKKIYAGAGVVLNGGYLEPASTATGLVSAGRAEQTVDNTDGSDGDASCRVLSGIFPFKNSASTDAIGRADIGNDAYWVDDQTVAKTSGSSSRSVAGKIFDVDDDGVWVEVG